MIGWADFLKESSPGTKAPPPAKGKEPVVPVVAASSKDKDLKDNKEKTAGSKVAAPVIPTPARANIPSIPSASNIVPPASQSQNVPKDEALSWMGFLSTTQGNAKVDGICHRFI